MHIRIHLLRRFANLPATLQSDGWKLEPERGGVFRAHHPLAADQIAARSRLHRLGLLTSGSVRIEFRPGRGGGAAAGKS